MRQLQLEHKGRIHTLGTSSSRFTIERDRHSNSLGIAHKKVSREHCCIHIDKNKITREDYSTNGTFFVTQESENPDAFRRAPPSPRKPLAHTKLPHTAWAS